MDYSGCPFIVYLLPKYLEFTINQENTKINNNNIYVSLLVLKNNIKNINCRKITTIIKPFAKLLAYKLQTVKN